MYKQAFTHSRNVKLLTALTVVAVAGALSGLAIAGSSSVSTPRLGSNVVVPSGKATAMARRMPTALTDSQPRPGAGPPVSASRPAFTRVGIPARIQDSNVPPPISASIISTANSWLVSNGIKLVAVYAGSAGNDPSQGRVAILRQNLRTGDQSIRIVDAGSTGRLTVAASAPNGASVENSALTGRLDLRTSHGTLVHLDLRTNTISTN